MINQLSTYLQGKLLNAAFRDTAYTSPSTVYAALFTTEPNAGGSGGTEVTGNGYARTAVTFAAPSGGIITNSAAAVSFPVATAGWGTIVAVGIYDAATSGNMLAVGPLTASQVILVGQVFEFSTSELTVQLV